MERYQCQMCNYVYDPGAGDPGQGVSPKTPFGDLPDRWKCPVCGATKNYFEKEAKVAPPH